MTEVNKGGRPRKFETPEELNVLIDKYFKKRGKKTITGMVLFLGFCDRSSFYDYEKRSEFSYAIKRARTLIEEYYEKHLLHVTYRPTGPIFALKNLGWRDERQIETKDITPIDQRIINARSRRNRQQQEIEECEEEVDE